MDNLGERLKGIRMKQGLSLRELARQANVSPSFISQIDSVCLSVCLYFDP